jgi:hypothetical protein
VLSQNSALLPKTILSVDVDVDERDLLSRFGADLTKLCKRSGRNAGKKPRSRCDDMDDGPHVFPLVVVDDEVSSSDGTLGK